MAIIVDRDTRLVVQGLTLKPLIQALRLRDDDPVGREAEAARERALAAALAALDGDRSSAADAVRSTWIRSPRATARANSGTTRLASAPPATIS